MIEYGDKPNVVIVPIQNVIKARTFYLKGDENNGTWQVVPKDTPGAIEVREVLK